MLMATLLGNDSKLALFLPSLVMLCCSKRTAGLTDAGKLECDQCCELSRSGCPCIVRFRSATKDLAEKVVTTTECQSALRLPAVIVLQRDLRGDRGTLRVCCCILGPGCLHAQALLAVPGLPGTFLAR